MILKKIIPSILTSLNLLFGSLSVIFSIEGFNELAIYSIFIAAIFDFADGFSARLFNAISEFGKQLDSLSDLISFGFAPAMIFYFYIDKQFPGNNYLKFLPIIIIIFSALRLAKFNIDASQSKSFKGLPTPANAIFIVSILHANSLTNNIVVGILSNQIIVGLIIIVLSLLLVSPIKMFSLKITNIKFRDNIYQIILVFSAIILIVFLDFLGIAISIILYIALSIIKSIFEKNYKKIN
ncbi:MAG: CDP-diacylglycerol---serine O-phosphatidyltransferase [Anaerophaga sp.]|nr:CDP-diacylglycerol---serine O-phosphatidyltransferase [Anaerophaga sp.]